MSGSDPEAAFCTECGNEVEANTKFCTECGAEQAVGTVEGETGGSPDEANENKSTLHRLPGFSPGNSTRRNVIVGAGYSFVGLFAIGAAAGPQEEGGDGGSSGGGDGGSSGGGDGGSSGGGDGGTSDQYSNAWAYDDNTGMVIENSPEVEISQIGSMYIRGTARNDSGSDYDYVQLTFDVMDSSGAKIADALDNTSGLEAGQSWRFEALAASAEDADSYRLADITAY